MTPDTVPAVPVSPPAEQETLPGAQPATPVQDGLSQDNQPPGDNLPVDGTEAGQPPLTDNDIPEATSLQVAPPADTPVIEAAPTSAEKTTGSASTESDANNVTTVAGSELDAVPDTRQVSQYGDAWIAYGVCAVLFLVLAWRVMRNWSAWLRLPIWAALTAGALTPAASVPDQDWFAPAAVVAVLGAEKGGASAFFRGAVPILLVFAGLLLVLIAAQIAIARRRPAKETATRNGHRPQATPLPRDAAHDTQNTGAQNKQRQTPRF